MRHIYFITDNTDIKSGLIEIGLTESKVYGMEPREWLHKEIKSDTCREFVSMIHTIKQNVLDTATSAIFIHNGDELLGLVLFGIDIIDGVNTLIIDYICVPKRYHSEKRGTILLRILKKLGPKLKMQEIGLVSIPEAKKFYEKNGFIENPEDKNVMIYKFNKSVQKTHTRKSRRGKSLPTPYTRSLSKLTAASLKNKSRKIHSASI